ncbi:MAG: RNA polymerase sigma factor [Solirubrobacteraceae bacterium]
MGTHGDRGDDDLLGQAARGDGAAFGAFYERHLPVVVAYVRRRTSSSEVVADLTGRCSRPRSWPVRGIDRVRRQRCGWLLGIASNKLRETARRGRVHAAARRRLGLAEIMFVEDDLARVEELADAGSVALAQLAGLPEDQRTAVWGRIVEEKGYDRLARELGCSEALVRQRVSRGLRRLRTRMEEDR